MNYIEYTFHFDRHAEIASDLLSADLAEIGFESFTQSDATLTAYVPEHLADAEAIDLSVTQLPIETTVEYDFALIEGQDWNAEWEKNYFEPIHIEDRCVIRSSFHPAAPDVEYEIIIDPKMAFGTGHHETTHLMIETILSLELDRHAVLDMGCGTAVLAILAQKHGAKGEIVGIDIDQWAYDNAVENCRLNHCEGIKIETGDALTIAPRTFDLIIANINRNILLNDMHHYVAALNTGGRLLISGFYTEDIPMLVEKAHSLGLTKADHKERNNWAMVAFSK